MTNQKQHPGNAVGNTVNSITFFNPPYNSQQTTHQQQLQQTTAASFSSLPNQQLISSANISHISTENLTHRIHHAMQAHSSPQLFYSTTPLQTPFATITIPSAEVRYANIVTSTPSTSSISSSTDDTSSTASAASVASAANEKRAQKLARNRIAAKECRERKKAYILNLESKASRLEDENSILRQKIQELKTRLEWIESKQQENIRLENIVKELKIKVIKMESCEPDQDLSS